MTDNLIPYNPLAVSDDKRFFWDGERWDYTPFGARLAQMEYHGWVVVGRQGNHYELTAAKKFSVPLLLILLVFGILPGILYAVIVAAQSQPRALLVCDEQGRLTR
jgi:hypothetical protein